MLQQRRRQRRKRSRHVRGHRLPASSGVACSEGMPTRGECYNVTRLDGFGRVLVAALSGGEATMPKHKPCQSTSHAHHAIDPRP